MSLVHKVVYMSKSCFVYITAGESNLRVVDFEFSSYVKGFTLL